MRVLHFYKTYYPDSWGGVEQAIRQICVGTGRLGITNEVLTLTRNQGGRMEIDGHVVHRVRQDVEIASNAMSFASIGALARLARTADVVHYHFPWPFGDLAHFLARVKKPSVVTYHSDIVRQKTLLKVYSPLMRRFLADVDAIVATSPNYFASSDVLRRHGDKVRAIPFGLDRTTYPSPSPELLARWRERVGERFFLFVGVLRYYKGLHILLDALARQEYPVVIVGAGPIENELKEHARRLGLTQVRFVGAVDEHDKAALLTLSYAMAFPSHLRSEAFGISLLEGAMYGKPMISSEIGTGTSYINVGGETGIVVPPAIRRLSLPRCTRCGTTRHWRRRWASGHPSASTRCSRPKKMAADYAAVYREVAKSSTRVGTV